MGVTGGAQNTQPRFQHEERKKLSTRGETKASAHLAEVVELLGNEESSALNIVALSNHGAVGTVSSTEGIRAVDVGELAERLAEGLDLGLLGLNLLAIDLALALLLDIEADVLEEDDGARGRVSTGSLDLSTNAVVEHGHRLADKTLKSLSHRLEGVLLVLLAVRAAKVRGENNALGTIVEAVLDRRNGTLDTRGVGDDAGVLLVLGNVEVNADENALVLDVNVLELELLQRCHFCRQNKEY
jgi:hypothetical protein